MFYRMVRMKTTLPIAIGCLLLAGAVMFGSCAQDAVFYTIQYDKELNKNPVIPGGPTKIVELDNALYVGSNHIYRYAASSWGLLPDPPGGKKILDLAVTDSYLYALVMTGSDLSDSMLCRLKNTDINSGSWEAVNKNSYSRIQSIYGAGDTLFAGAYPGVLLYVDDTPPGGPVFKEIRRGGMLKAAAFNSKYYVSLMGEGILTGDKPADLENATPLTASSGNPGNFLGLIEIGGELIAVSGDGWIWRIDNTGAVVETKNYGTLFNGALAKWKDPVDSGKTVDLLLLGRAVSGGSSLTTYYYGYYELPTGTDGKLNLTAAFLQTPGYPLSGVPSSVSRYDTYYNTLGTHAVTSLYQAPWDKALFASTQKDGLWSCRGNTREWDVE
jgi:hypothetical protein